MIGAANAARAVPDGYTILLSARGVFAIVPNMRKVEFDPLHDLQPVARIVEVSRAFAIHPRIPAQTLAEFGYPAVRTSGWQELFGPANLPADVLSFYSRNIAALDADEAFRKRLIAVSAVPAYLGPAEFARQVADDNAYFGKLIRDADIKLQN